MGDGDTLVDVLLADGLAGRLGGYGLDGLAMDGNLPAADALVGTIVLFPDGQPPLLEQMHRGIHVATHVIDKVLACQTHHVVDHILHEVGRGIPAIALAHVAVDGGQALAGGAAAFNDGLFGDDHPQVAAPEFGLEGGAATGHAAADNQNVALNGFNCRRCHFVQGLLYLLAGRVGKSSTPSQRDSPARPCPLRSATGSSVKFLYGWLDPTGMERDG